MKPTSILSFSGRKRCGKTLLANICIKYNYELINFADALKNLLCNVLNITKEYLEKNKDILIKEVDLSNKIKYIAESICVDENLVRKCLRAHDSQYRFNSIRKLLQIIGTDLIRYYNPNWHVNKVKTKIECNPDKKYCIGDTRFKNEKKMIEELNGECWFIIRPSTSDISNHESEIDLRWTDFGHNIIINNINKTILTKRWENYMNSMNSINSMNPTCNINQSRLLLCNLLEYLSIYQIAKKLKCKSGYITTLINNLMLHKFQYKIDAKIFDTKIQNISITRDNYNSTLHFKHENSKDTDDTGDTEEVTCPFIIENIKLQL